MLEGAGLDCRRVDDRGSFICGGAEQRILSNSTEPGQIIATLDEISRRRALTQTESLLLERSILLEKGEKLPAGLTKALARRGVKRNMSVFAQRALQRRLDG